MEYKATHPPPSRHSSHQSATSVVHYFPSFFFPGALRALAILPLTYSCVCCATQRRTEKKKSRDDDLTDTRSFKVFPLLSNTTETSIHCSAEHRQTHLQNDTLFTVQEPAHTNTCQSNQPITSKNPRGNHSFQANTATKKMSPGSPNRPSCCSPLNPSRTTSTTSTTTITALHTLSRFALSPKNRLLSLALVGTPSPSTMEEQQERTMGWQELCACAECAGRRGRRAVVERERRERAKGRMGSGGSERVQVRGESGRGRTRERE
ncbi:hypothetical protein HDK77DRAFT_506616 [Phyllosticta capitalensis]